MGIQENTNKAIVINSLILYLKMGVSIICGLLATRFALQALGVTDFGLFSLLGGFISFVGIINTIQVSTSNRFIAVAIGKGDIDEINQQFNVNLIIHAIIAVITALIVFPIGDWYISHYVNYEGDYGNVRMVFYLTAAASILSFVSVPYHGLLMAKERFAVFSSVDIISHIIKLVFTYFLISYDGNRLLLYTLVITFFSIYQLPVYYIYCKRKWPDVVRGRIVKDKNKYKAVFGFSGWVAYGAIAYIAKSHGAALIINLFFNTAMNTALGIANSVHSYLGQFANNVAHPIAPQITKSYAAGNKGRTDYLLVMSTKVTFFFMLLISTPFLAESEWILQLWLKDVPPYSCMFVIFLIIDGLVASFNSGISNIIFASGKIKLYQISVSTVRLISVAAAYLVLKAGTPPYYLYVVYIAFSVFMVFLNQYVLHKTLNFDNTILWKKSYFPSLGVSVLFVPYLLLPINIHPLLNIIVSVLYVLVLEWFVGLTTTERSRLRDMTKNKLHIR